MKLDTIGGFPWNLKHSAESVTDELSSFKAQDNESWETIFLKPSQLLFLVAFFHMFLCLSFFLVPFYTGKGPRGPWAQMGDLAKFFLARNLWCHETGEIAIIFHQEQKKNKLTRFILPLFFSGMYMEFPDLCKANPELIPAI